MAEQSKKHGMKMFKAGDKDHLKAMKEMQQLMHDPKAMQKWFESKRNEFNTLPENQ